MGYATPIDISDEDMLYSVLTRPIPPKTEYAKQRPATPTELSTSSDDISSDNESICACKLRPVTPVLTETSTSDVYSSDTDTELVSERTPEADPAELEPAECAVAPRTWRQAIEPRLWSVATLVGIFACAPLVVACWAVLVALGRTFGERLAAIGGKRCDEVKPNGKVAIVSGGKMTKAYVIARQLKAQGCRVVLLETSKYWMVASRASNCVDRFAMVPLPEKDLAGYLDAVRALAIEEKADLFIPVTSPAASEYEAQVAPVLPAGCVSWSLDLETVRDLDDKTAFCSSAERLGLPAPRSHRVASDEEAHAFNEKLLAEAATATADAETRYILKSLAYDSMHRLDLFTLPCAPDVLDAYLAKLHTDGAAITQENPWIIQTFVVGDEYSTCALVKEGRLLAFTDNRACLSCFNYTPARSEALRSWVRDFCAARRLSGVVCIDFIVDAQSGTPYAIECNPRFSSNVLNLLSNPAFGAALIRPDEVVDAVEPLAAQGETYFLFAEIWALLSKRPFSLRSAGALLSTVATKKDAYFDVADPLPFIAHLFVHIPALLARNLSTGNKWAKIDPCIGKLTEENGD